MDHYLSVGRSAIDVIAKAMISAGSPEISSVLDMPSGCGRVTRHLRAFFHESDIYAADIEPSFSQFCTELGAIQFEADCSFDKPSSRRFDLIWVGSLLTHLDEDQFKRALTWFSNALEPDGLAVITLHGRRHIERETEKPCLPEERWQPMIDGFNRTGFGYAPDNAGAPIGMTLSASWWVLREVEHLCPQSRIVGFDEAGWVDDQDGLIISRPAST